MSKQTNEKLVSNIASIDAKITAIEESKQAAQSRLDRADQDIRERRATRTGYVALLESRGYDENGVAIADDGNDDEVIEFG